MDNTLEKINKEILNCQKCLLYKTRIHPVPGEGSSHARIMFIGEAPGNNEDKEGRPFCGASGKILDQLLESAGIKREEIFIANILKCRPPENRNPLKEEIDVCSFFLDKQIETINPKVLCTLGNFSTSYVLEKYGLKDQVQGISKIHGNIFEIKTLLGIIKIVPLYHPAVATYNMNMMETLKNDFQILKKL